MRWRSLTATSSVITQTGVKFHDNAGTSHDGTSRLSEDADYLDFRGRQSIEMALRCKHCGLESSADGDLE